MDPYIKNRVGEIETHLGSFLRELGLAVRVTRSANPRIIQFVGKRDQGWQSFSPISIGFDPQKDSGLDEAGWENAWLRIEDWHAEPLGLTGWTHQRFWDVRHPNVDYQDPSMFEAIANTVRAAGVVDPRLEKPNMVDSEELADACLWIRNAIDDLAIVRIPYRERNCEALTFVDSEGRRVHICFPMSANTMLLVDGEELGIIHGRPYDVASLANTLKAGRNPERFLLPKPF